MRNLLPVSLFFLVFLAPACRRDETPTYGDPIQQIRWAQAPGFSDTRKKALNSAVWDDQLYILTNGSLAEAETNGQAFHRLHFGNPGDFRMPLNSDLFITLRNNSGSLGVFPSRNPQTVGAAYFTEIASLHPDVSGLHPFANGTTLAANGKRQFLLPVLKKDGYGALLLFDVQVVLSGGVTWKVDTAIAKMIDLPNLNWIGAVNAIDDNFLVAFSSTGTGGTALVRPDGSVSVVLDQHTLVRVFPSNNFWYAVSADGLLFRSSDAGQHWEPLGSAKANGLSNFNAFTLGYGTVSGKPVLFSQTHLHVLEENAPNGFAERAPALEGLDGGPITSLTEWRDNVFVTTLQGVYVLPVNDFLESLK